MPVAHVDNVPRLDECLKNLKSFQEGLVGPTSTASPIRRVIIPAYLWRPLYRFIKIVDSVNRDIKTNQQLPPFPNLVLLDQAYSELLKVTGFGDPPSEPPRGIRAVLTPDEATTFGKLIATLKESYL